MLTNSNKSLSFFQVGEIYRSLWSIRFFDEGCAGIGTYNDGIMFEAGETFILTKPLKKVRYERGFDDDIDNQIYHLTFFSINRERVVACKMLTPRPWFDHVSEIPRIATETLKT